MAAVADPATRRFGVRGMTCASCERRVRRALAAVPGVEEVLVDVPGGVATLRYDPARAPFVVLQAAVAAAGYELAEEAVAREPVVRLGLVGPVATGAAAAAALLAFYLGLITLAQGWEHAVQQLAEDRWFVLALASGFGVQGGLFAYLRALHAGARAAGVAASTGTSATAMLACCAHHLADVLPIVGVAGAAAVLDAYKTPLLWLGVAMNLGGVVYLLAQVRRSRRMACRGSAEATPSPHPGEDQER
jgi:copper chaperone CopZ